MRKLIVASSFIFFGLMTSARAQVAKGLFHSHYASSGVVFSGGGTLVKVQVSSVPATQAFNTQYVQFFDTAVANMPAGGYLSFTTTQTVTPPIMMTSSGTVTIQPGGNGYVVNWGPEGIYINNGLYIFFGLGGTSGERNATVYWRREE